MQEVNILPLSDLLSCELKCRFCTSLGTIAWKIASLKICAVVKGIVVVQLPLGLLGFGQLLQQVRRRVAIG